MDLKMVEAEIFLSYGVGLTDDISVLNPLHLL